MQEKRATARLQALLGGLPASVFETECITPLDPDGAAHEVRLRRQDGVLVRGFLTGWSAAAAGAPALVYIHAHGGRYDIGARELLDGRAALLSPLGPVLAKAGIAALCIDLPCFGARAAETESAASKRHLWHGTTLFGEMLADLTGTIDWLQALQGIDPNRIGAFGLSMGATLTFWLAALDPRIKAAAHLCCFADLATLVAEGGHDRHGQYMTVPGLLPAFRTGEIAGLIAPRPQIACMGSEDALTPPVAIERGLTDLIAAYAAQGAEDHLTTLIEPVGHVETATMRAAVLRFMAAHL